MKKKYHKKYVQNPIATFTPPPMIAGFDFPDNPNSSTPEDAPGYNDSSSSSQSNGISWVNSIGSVLKGLLDSFNPIANAIWGGDKSANVVDDSKNTTNFILIGGIIVIVIILILFLNKK